MPQVQVINTAREKREPSDVSRMFSKLSQSYKEVQDQEEFSNLISSYQQNQNDANALENLWANLAKSTLGPTKRLEAMNTIKGMSEIVKAKNEKINKQLKEQVSKDEKAKKEQKALEDRQRVQQSIKQLYLDNDYPEEEAERLSKLDSEAMARSRVQKKANDNKKQPTAFEKTYETAQAKDLIELEKDIPKAEDALSNLDRIESLAANELKGAKGFVKSLLSTESAAEMQNLGFTAIEPIIKLFNPVGPIPVQKLKIIQSEFQPRAKDFQSTITGKVNALRRIGQQGIKRAKERAEFIRKHRGKPPEEELKTFDAVSSSMLDILIDEEKNKISGKETNQEKPKEKEGMVQVTDPQGILRWVPKEIAEKLKAQK